MLCVVAKPLLSLHPPPSLLKGLSGPRTHRVRAVQRFQKGALQCSRGEADEFAQLSRFSFSFS